jgi:hypothetical protein
VLLFKRILRFKREFLAKLRDKRKSTRYAVGPRFPLKATVNLTGQVAGAALSGKGYDWGGRLINLSNNGAGLQLLRAATTVRGEKTELRLALEDHQLAIPCVVAHFRTYSGYSLCGLSLHFIDFKVQKGYLQLVEAISMGASFTPLKTKGLAPNRPGLVAERFTADNKAVLTAWRTVKGNELDGFELAVAEHCVKGGATVPPLVVFRLTKPPKVEASAEVAGEVRRLFRWMVPNLPKAVPADLRALMEQAANARTPSEVAADGSFRASSPPDEWQPPAAKV